MFPVFISVCNGLITVRAAMGLYAFESSDAWRVADLEGNPVADGVIDVLLPFAR